MGETHLIQGWRALNHESNCCDLDFLLCWRFVEVDWPRAVEACSWSDLIHERFHVVVYSLTWSWWRCRLFGSLMTLRDLTTSKLEVDEESANWQIDDSSGAWETSWLDEELAMSLIILQGFWIWWRTGYELDSSSRILGKTSELAGGIFLSLSLVRCSPSGPLSAFISAPLPLWYERGYL